MLLKSTRCLFSLFIKVDEEKIIAPSSLQLQGYLGILLLPEMLLLSVDTAAADGLSLSADSGPLRSGGSTDLSLIGLFVLRRLPD